MAKTLGISPNYEGLRIVSGNNSYFFPPSSFAEAVIGVASEHEIREMLDSVTIDSVLNKVPFELPYLEAFLSSQNGEDPWSELEEAVMRHHEGVKNLLRIESVRGESTSPLKVSRATVKRRGSAVHERDRHTNIRGYKFIGAELTPEFDISCDCGPFRFSTAKAQYRKNDPTSTHLACYHLASHLYYLSASEDGVFLPFDFRDDPELTLEAFVMRKVFNKDYAEVDRFLLSHDVLTKQAKDMVRKRKASVEVLKSQYNFGDMRRVIYELEDYIRGRGYSYKGFAVDFQNRPEETVGIVYEKADGSAIHILFDQKKWTMPFIVEKIPQNGGYYPEREERLLHHLNTRIDDFDVMRQRRDISKISLPPSIIFVGTGQGLTREQAQEYKKLTRQ